MMDIRDSRASTTDVGPNDDLIAEGTRYVTEKRYMTLVPGPEARSLITRLTNALKAKSSSH